MSSNSNPQPQPHSLTFYPAYCYPSSPTYFTWVKLTCFDVHHTLRAPPSRTRQPHTTPSGNNLYFYLNHPIQFIQLTGIVAAIEDYHPHIFLFTLDDSSGSTIDIVWRKPKQPLNVPPSAPAKAVAANTKTRTDGPLNNDNEEDSLLPLLPLLSSLHIGTPVLVKGTLTTFRATLQLSLLRLTPITPTQELRLISSRTAFLTNTLSKPWVVSASSQKKLLARANGEKSKESERGVRARKRREQAERREVRHAAEVQAQYVEEEKQRAKEAEIARLEGTKAMRCIEEKREKRRA